MPCSTRGSSWGKISGASRRQSARLSTPRTRYGTLIPETAAAFSPCLAPSQKTGNTPPGRAGFSDRDRKTLSRCNIISAGRSHAQMRNLPTAPSTDQQLVAQVLGGNTAAFEHLVRRTEGLVTQLVFKMIRHPADRPDVAQDVYLKVFRCLAGFKFQAKLSTWVGQIAYNTCLHYLEKKQLVLLDPAETAPDDPPEEGRRAPPALVAGPDYDPEAALFGHDLAGILGTAIEQLPPLYRTLIALYHQQELSYEEIAQITSLPDGTVKNYLFRARKLLKQQLLARYQRDDL